MHGSGGCRSMAHGDAGDIMPRSLTSDPTLEKRLLPDIEERARAGLAFLAVASAVLVAVDFQSESPNAMRMALIDLCRVLAFGALFAFLRRPRGPIVARLAGLAGIAVLSSTSAVMGPLRGDFGPHLVVAVATGLGCAAGIPWGVWPQIAATMILTAGLVVNLALLPDHGGGIVSTNGVFAYLMTMGSSIYIAALDGFRRRAAAEALGEAQRADEALRDLNETLERSVRERTADLARANAELELSNRELATTNRSLEQAYRELQGFTQTVSHDLRVPLRVIHGLSHLALEQYGEKLDEQGRGYLARIGESAVRLGMIGDDLLTLARVTRATMLSEAVDITALARSVVEAQRRQEPQRQVEVSIEEGLSAHGDPFLLRIVLEQLVSNCWKFTRDRQQARIDVAGLAAGEHGFLVRDNGIGFPAEFAGKLFARFERLHDQPDLEGTGIGLAIVQRIVSRHGGRVWAERNPDAGATFSVALPH